MKLDIQHVIFSDEKRATLDGTDEWTKEWVVTEINAINESEGSNVVTVLCFGQVSLILR